MGSVLGDPDFGLGHLEDRVPSGWRRVALGFELSQVRAAVGAAGGMMVLDVVGLLYLVEGAPRVPFLPSWLPAGASSLAGGFWFFIGGVAGGWLGGVL